MRVLQTRTTHAFIAIAAALLAPAVAKTPLQAQSGPEDRPVIGVAFGGGSALGLAHVGVIRWFEQHHIPIDVVAGTSMGGLVGGAFASGMSSDVLRRFLRAYRKTIDHAYASDDIPAQWAQMNQISVETAKKVLAENFVKEWVLPTSVRPVSLSVEEAVRNKYMAKPMTEEEVQQMFRLVSEFNR